MLELKQKKVQEIKQVLKSKSNFVLFRWSGMKVKEQVSLRSEMREVGGDVKVVKNTLFIRALREAFPDTDQNTFLSMDKDLKGPVVAVFADESLPSIAKVLFKRSKEMEDLLVVKSGFFDEAYLSFSEVKEVSNLLGRSELLNLIARGFNNPTTKIAMGVKEIMASLARGIQKVGGKNSQ